MKTFFLWVVVYIPGVIEILFFISYYLGILDPLFIKYGVDMIAMQEQCFLL